MAVAQRVAEEVLATCRQKIGVASNADPEQPEVRMLVHSAYEGARLHGPSGPEAPEARLDCSRCPCGGARGHDTHCEQVGAQGNMF